MNLPWFKRIGIFYLPASIVGWLILAAALVYAVKVFIEIDSVSHSVSDTLINFVFNLFIIGVVYSFIGYLTGRELK